MADKKERNASAKSRSRQTDKPEGKRSLLILSQVIALIICLLISFSVWLVVHYRADRKNDSSTTSGEAYGAYSFVASAV